jgi:hypothetical protein
LRHTLKLHDFFDNKPAITRAFEAAKVASKSKKKYGADYVEYGAEFRLLLFYLREYLEYYIAFRECDIDDDDRVSIQEFKQSVDKLRTWGINIDLTNFE